jgi:hypothetical protein
MSDPRRLLTELADHLEGIAHTLRKYDPGDDDQDEAFGDPPTPWEPGDAVQRAKELHPPLGSHQELVIRTLAAAHPRGCSASEINANPNTLPNTYLTLDRLTELRLVRRDDQVHPRQYYLVVCLVNRLSFRS